MKVVSICGSLRPSSSTQRALHIALQAAEAAGAEVHAVQLRELELPWCDGRADEDSYGGDTTELRAHVAAADALLLGSPEYHGSLSGALKNTLDLLGPEQLRGKMIGLLATARGPAGAMNTLNHLRHIARWVDAWVLPRQVSIPEAGAAFDAEGKATRPGLDDELTALGTELLRYARMHAH
jgi:FMN reductase